MAGGFAHPAFGPRVPKPLLPVRGRPVLDPLLEALEGSSVEQVFVSHARGIDLRSRLAPVGRTVFLPRPADTVSYAAAMHAAFLDLSSHCGVDSIRNHTVLLLPCDIPLVTAPILEALLKKTSGLDADVALVMVAGRLLEERYPGKRFAGIHLSDHGGRYVLQNIACIRGTFFSEDREGELVLGTWSEQEVRDLARSVDRMRDSRERLLQIPLLVNELLVRRLVRERRAALVVRLVTRLLTRRFRVGDGSELLQTAFRVRAGVVDSKAPELSGDIDTPDDLVRVLGDAERTRVTEDRPPHPVPHRAV